MVSFPHRQQENEKSESFRYTKFRMYFSGYIKKQNGKGNSLRAQDSITPLNLWP